MSENISFNSAELGAPVETLGYEQARAELEQRRGCRARRSA